MNKSFELLIKISKSRLFDSDDPGFRDKVVKLFSFLGCILLIFTGLLSILPALTFFAGVSISPIHFIIVSVISILSTYLLSSYYYNGTARLKNSIIVIFLSALILVFCFTAAGEIYDVSVDGLWYHQEAVINLAEGWNPVYGNVQPDVRASQLEKLTFSNTTNIWINAYPKGTWIFQAAVYRLTGNLEQGKGLNLLLIIISFLFSVSGLLRFDKIKSMSVNFIIAFLLAFNPVSMCQVFTFCIDGVFASLLLIFLALVFHVFVDSRRRRLLFSLLFLTTVMLLNIRITAIPFLGLWTAGLVISLYFHKSRELAKSFSIVVISGFITGILIIGYAPYVTNHINYGHPLHPYWGKDKVSLNFSSERIPFTIYMESKSSLECLAISLFCKSKNDEKIPEMKIPFTIHQNESLAFMLSHPNTGGFGPLFGGIFLLAIVILIYCTLIFGKAVLPFVLITLSLILSVVIHPYAWWNRYIPQLFFFPIVMSIMLFTLENRGFLRKTAWLLIILLMYNSLFIFYSAATGHFISQSLTRIELKQLADSDDQLVVYFGFQKAVKKRFARNNINYVEIPPEELGKYNFSPLSFTRVLIAYESSFRPTEK
jgi:hypothetical protein